MGFPPPTWSESSSASTRPTHRATGPERASASRSRAGSRPSTAARSAPPTRRPAARGSRACSPGSLNDFLVPAQSRLSQPSQPDSEMIELHASTGFIDGIARDHLVGAAALLLLPLAIHGLRRLPAW